MCVWVCVCARGNGNGGACVSKSLYPQLSTTPPTRGPSVEAECVLDDRVFSGRPICEPYKLTLQTLKLAQPT